MNWSIVTRSHAPRQVALESRAVRLNAETVDAGEAREDAQVGLGRIVALYYYSSTLYHIH